jgi:arylsulfatase A-like enzyme
VVLDLPVNGRLAVALGVEDGPATLRIRAGSRVLLEQAVTDWTQASVSLEGLAGSVELVFEVESEQAEAQGLWGAPTVTGLTLDRPNVLFYVIDGGGADLMSAYGYHRPTTPQLERLGAQGVVFENARTSSAWTKPSTASFMTSLHHSALGGFTKNEDRIPDSAVTMAEHFHAAGYQTGVFTSNPFAGSMSGLESGVDLFRDKGAQPNSTSSTQLHKDFWQWRDDWPAGPWWVHIQTTDVHEPHHPVAPYAGRYASDQRRTLFQSWLKDLHGLDIQRDTVLERYRARLAQMGVDQRDFFRTQWDLYDETMAHNDTSLADLVAELDARGERDNTILIIAADHGHPAGSFSRFGRGMLDPQPDDWEGAFADAYRTHVPLIVVWPGHLPEGLRIQQHVSMLDVLPTVLELAQLPAAQVQQGRSLVPLLTGGTLPEQPVVIEQVQAYKPSKQMVGHIELIDGRWAASLEVMPESLVDTFQSTDSLVTAGGWRAARPHRPTTPRLLLYDLESDPFCTKSVHAQHPERIARYTAQLEALWLDHQKLAEQFEAGGDVKAGQEQIEALRTLGYVD